MPFVKVNLELSVSPVPDTSEYVGFWPSRYAFWALILPTVWVSLRAMLSSSTIYHGPRFWSKSLLKKNMFCMSVTPETFQEDMSLLNEIAR